VINKCSAHDVSNSLHGLHCMLKARKHKSLGSDTRFDNTEEVAYCDFNIQFNEYVCYQVKYTVTTKCTVHTSSKCSSHPMFVIFITTDTISKTLLHFLVQYYYGLAHCL
jgi:hypothetical protein